LIELKNSSRSEAAAVRTHPAGAKMKAVPLILVVFLECHIFAQKLNLQPQPDTRPSAEERFSSVAQRAFCAPVNDAAVSLASPEQSSSGSQKRTKRRTEKRKAKARRPAPEPSMVGYVDDAIVGSQIRIRFDAGFHDTVPDRSEFF
jgi:hypothetical protein